MHETYSDEIMPGVRLTCLITGKFKTGCLSINLISSLNRDTAASSALLPRVLRRGSADLPEMELIAAALDELYGARVEPIVRKKGELHCIGFFADFPDDRLIPGNESVLEKTLDLVGSVLLNPDMRDGLLRSDYVESEKKNLIDDICAAINDKRGYSIDRLLEEMCSEEAYGVNKLGSVIKAQAITPASLTAHYRHLIANSKIEIFYCGSADPGRIKSALLKALSGLPPGCREQMVPKTEVILYPPGDAPRRHSEALDVSQGKLAVGFRLGRGMKNPDYPALMVFNAIYGGSVTSKLFLNVRERLSLCYYASSMLDKHKGIMIVASGVEFSNFETALVEILLQLGNVKKGDVSDWELLSAKRAVMTGLKSNMDRPGGLENMYFDSAISDVPYDPATLCDGVEGITLDHIVELATEVEPDLIYFLNGEESSA